MNAEEKKVLHGLYFRLEFTNEAVPVDGDQILWLMQSSLPLPKFALWQRHSTRDWKEPGPYGDVRGAGDTEVIEMAARKGAVPAYILRPLRYLEGEGLIKYWEDGGLLFVSVTNEGANTARKLDTVSGRVALWFQQNMALLLALAATATIISFIISMLGRYWG